MPKNETIKKGSSGKEYKYKRIRRKVGQRYIDSTGEYIAVYKEFYGKTKKEALQKYEQYLEQNIFAKNRCLDDLVKQWIKEIFVPDSKYTERTKGRYIDAYNNNLAKDKIAGRCLQEITAPDLQAAYNRLKCAPTTVVSCHRLIRLFYRYIEHNGIHHDITETITLPAPKRAAGSNIVVWSDSELDKIKSGIKGQRLELLLYMAMYTGARLSELRALKYSDIRDNQVIINKQVVETPIIENGKTKGYDLSVDYTKSKNSVRSIPIKDELIELLKAHKKRHLAEQEQNGYNTDFMFTTKSGGFLDKSDLKRALKRFYKRIGVDYKSFHTYRHTFATQLAFKGVPIQTVSALLGHADISVTAQYYINVPDQAKQNAIDLL